jgi:hypothetical protein
MLYVNMIIGQKGAGPPRSRALCGGGEAHYFPPVLEPLSHFLPVCRSRKPMPARTEMRPYGAGVARACRARSHLIDSLPPIVAFTLDRQKDLLEVPCVARPRASPAKLIRVCLAECATLLADRFIRHEHAADQQACFHLAIAEAAAVVQPDAVADDRGGEAVGLVAGREWSGSSCVISLTVQPWSIAILRRRGGQGKRHCEGRATVSLQGDGSLQLRSERAHQLQA